MLAAPWVCRSCIRALQRPTDRALAAFVRHASTEPQPQATLSKALLQRARSMTAEHDTLTSSLSETFDPKRARRIGELSSVANALRSWDSAQSSLTELRSLLDDSTSQDDEVSSDAEFRQLATDELSATSAQLSQLSHKLTEALTPKDPFARLPCLVEVRPGPGGLEGRFFADTVFKMYRQFCVRKGFRASVLKYDMADGAGDQATSAGESPLQEAVLEIADQGAYDLFRSESGMHRVQRIPATEKNGRVHTSAVAVWVLPSFPESGSSNSNNGNAAGDIEDIDDPESDFYLNPSEVRIETMRARGAGGQHVNKTESAIRMTHTPTGTTVSMQDSRSQPRNRELAWKVLRSRVATQRRDAREEEAARLRDTVLAKNRITRGDKIRTYNYNQDRCTDHRSGVDVHNLPDVLIGGEGLDKIVDSAREWLVSSDIADMVAEEEAKAAVEAAAAAKAKHKGSKK